MNTFHNNLGDTWKDRSLPEQMANIGAEVGRSLNWRKKGNPQMSTNAFYRALELFDCTVADKKNKDRLSEILRVREFYVDYMIGENQYQFTDEAWEKYFLYFTIAARS
ncbi:hypothetical protein HGA88_04230 [Candidatus Roizmanbacteria bacterium]|nr:hypothetical protein [Candidatus Roizmanbacteria bacterium]